MPAGEVRSELAQSVDLGPTLCDLVGLDTPADLDGRRLFTDPAPDTVFSAIGYGNPSSRALAMLDRGEFLRSGWPQRFCVRTERWRYDRSTRADGTLLDESDQDRFLADGHSDPREERNVVDDPANDGVVAELEEALSVHLAGAVQTQPDDYALWRSSRGQHLTEQLKGL